MNKSSIKKKPRVDKREEKTKRIAIAISKMRPGESISYSTLARNINLHPDTFKDKLDEFDSLREVSFEIVRDKDKKLRSILKTEDVFYWKKNIIGIKKSLADIEEQLNEIQGKKKSEKNT